MNGREATVSLSQRSAPLDRDFVLSVEAAGSRRARRRGSSAEDDRATIAVGFVPPLADRSSSVRSDLRRRSFRIDGWHVDRRGAQRAAAVPALDDLRLPLQHHRVRLDNQALFPETAAVRRSQPCRRDRARARLQADLGGTEILRALTFVLEQPRSIDCRVPIVLLTDGEVTNTDEVIALASSTRAMRASSRSASARARASIS